MTERITLAQHFASVEQQRDAAQLGMWAFLASEALLFGGLFAAILVYRVSYPAIAAEASQHLHFWIGGLNTALLLTSSLTMTLAVLAARAGRLGTTQAWLGLTALLGVVFLGLKVYEYGKEYAEGMMPGIGPAFPLEQPVAELFFNLYFASTGLHFVHLLAGILACGLFMLLLAVRAIRLPQQNQRVEVLGMYWSMVDVIWLFLFSALYVV